MLRKVLVVGAAIAGASACAGFMRARAMWRTWGVDVLEGAKALPGDELVPDAAAVDTRVLDVAAPPEQVWPWLLQLGYGRAGWYSYDRMDMDRPSADRILPEHQSLAVGDIVPTDPRGGLEVKILDPEHALVLYLDRDVVQRLWGPPSFPAAETPANLRAGGAALDRAMAGDFAASWAIVLVPTASGTRLVERLRLRMESAGGRSLPAPLRSVALFGMFAMIRRQMLGIRDRVEGRPIPRARVLPSPA